MREILTYPLTHEQVIDEFRFFCELVQTMHYATCEVQFGGAWSDEFLPIDLRGKYVATPTELLFQKVSKLGPAGLSYLGVEDLRIRIPGILIEFLFCNDSDIHITYDEPHDLVELFYDRWKQLGYSPAEWAKSGDGQSERVRFN